MSSWVAGWVSAKIDKFQKPEDKPKDAGVDAAKK